MPASKSKKRSAKGQFVSKRSTKITRVESPPRKRRRARRNPDSGGSTGMLAPVTNPPEMSELAEFVLPGFAGYGVTKMLSRIVHTHLSKKYPNAGKHLAAGSTILSFLAAWFLLHRIKKLAQYQMPATVGAGIAALQTVVQTYLKKYSWMISDVTADQPNGPLKLTTDSLPETLFPGGPEIVDDDEDLTSSGLDDIDLGSLGGGAGDPSEYLS